jgi:hypothetical protein
MLQRFIVLPLLIRLLPPPATSAIQCRNPDVTTLHYGSSLTAKSPSTTTRGSAGAAGCARSIGIIGIIAQETHDAVMHSCTTTTTSRGEEEVVANDDM